MRGDGVNDVSDGDGEDVAVMEGRINCDSYRILISIIGTTEHIYTSTSNIVLLSKDKFNEDGIADGGGGDGGTCDGFRPIDDYLIVGGGVHE